VISIDWDGNEAGLKFSKEAEGALLPVAAPAPETLTEAAAARSDGRPTFFPAVNATSEAASEKKVTPSAVRGVPAEKAKNEKK